jgi:uncharacterized protein YjiS (DUF1127 family)
MTIFSRPSLRALPRIPSPGLLYAGVVAFARMIRNRRAAYHVSELPDYLLSDVGLKRDDVHEALNRGWREDPTFQLAIKASRRRRGL